MRVEYTTLDMNLVDAICTIADVRYDDAPIERTDGLECSLKSVDACFKCIRDVHFPRSGQQLYGCNKMIEMYPSTFLAAYTSEIYKTLEDRLPNGILQDAKMVSIGCGAAPDLCAVDLLTERGAQALGSFSYVGIEPNCYWEPFHNFLRANRNFATFYKENVLNLSPECIEAVRNCKVLVLQYFFSAVYDKTSRRINEAYFTEICEKIVRYMQEGGVIIINDTNSDEMGRLQWDSFYEMVKVIHPSASQQKFSYYKHQHFVEYGERIYKNSYQEAPVAVVMCVPDERRKKYKTRIICGSSQMIITL